MFCNQRFLGFINNFFAQYSDDYGNDDDDDDDNNNNNNLIVNYKIIISLKITTCDLKSVL